MVSSLLAKPVRGWQAAEAPGYPPAGNLYQKLFCRQERVHGGCADCRATVYRVVL